MPTNQQRAERYDTVSAVQQNLYASAEVGDFLRETFVRYGLNEKLYSSFALAFGDTALGFEEESRMPELLVERMGIPLATATPIAHDLLEYINQHKSLAPANEVQKSGGAYEPSQSAPPPVSAPPPSVPTQIPVTPLGASAPPPAPAQTPAPAQSAWTRRIDDNLSAVSQALATPEPNEPQSTIPSYAKPLTDVPKYSDEKPQ